MKRFRRRSYLLAVVAAVGVLFHSPLQLGAAPRSVYNGDGFTNASNTPAAGSGDGVSQKSGTYTYTFPISVPPGRLGLEPSVGFHYRSDGAIYGGIAAGWSLDLPTIQLDTSDGILAGEPRWVSSMAGGERLVPTSDAPGPGVVQVYRARYEITGTRYEHYAPGYPHEWVVRTANGGIFRFGRREVGVPVEELALLHEAEDTFGNRIDYVWSWSTVQLAAELSAKTYQLDAISYTSNPAASLPAFARVDFAYASSRPCANSRLPIGSQLSARTGTPTIHGYGRLQTISTSTVDRPLNGGLVRTYTLLYDPDEEGCGLDVPPRRQLIGIKSTGYTVDGSSIDAPPVTFDYHPRESRGYYRDTWTIGERENGHLHTRSSMFVDQMLVDMDGDGLPDRLTSDAVESCGFYWQRNTGFGFEEARRHVDRPNLPYGDVPDDWHFDDGPSGWGTEQRCALNLQYTLVVSDSVDDPDEPCRHDDKNYRVGTMVNWRFIDVDRDGLVDMVAGVDVNQLAVDADAPGFADQGLLDQEYDRYSPGTFYGQIKQLLATSQTEYEGNTAWECGHPVPVDEDKSYPWIVFRNTGGGHFAPAETWGMPVPVLASSTTARREIGRDQVGPEYDQITLPSGFAALLADPFSFVDIDGDGLLDVVSSFKTADELNGLNPPSQEWKVLRGRPDGLFEALPDDEPYVFMAPVHAHANGVYLDGGIFGSEYIDETSTGIDYSSSFGASASGLYELNGDGVPDFAWIESDSYDPDEFYDWNTNLDGWLGTGAEILSCQSSQSCALTFAPSEAVSDAGVSNLSMRWSHSTVVWHDYDDDGLYDHYTDTGAMMSTPSQLIDVDGDGRQDLVLANEVRYSVGDSFLPPRPLHPALARALRQGEYAPSSFFPLSHATTLLLDVDGDGRLDPMIHQITSLDPDGNYMIDDLGLEVFQEPGTWSVYLASREPTGFLSHISNGMGGETYIDYASVRDDWVVHDWALPVQTWVVSSITRTGGSAAPAQVTTYHYRDPAWVRDDDGQYGFRGFRHVSVASPTGALTESRFAYDLHYTGLEVEVVTSDSTAVGEPPRSVTSASYERLVLDGIPLIVPRQRDSRTCGATGTISDCRLNGALVRAHTEWRTIDALGVPQVYLPWRETSATSENVNAPGGIVTETEYETRIDAANFRVKPRTVERRVRTAVGVALLARATSIYDANLRALVETQTQVDETRMATTRFTHDPQTGQLLTTELPESVAGGDGEVTATVYDAYKASVRQVVNPLGHTVTTIRDLGTGAILTTQGPQYKCANLFVPCVGIYRRWRTTEQRHDGLGRPVSLSKSFDAGSTNYSLVEVERHTYSEWNDTQPAENKVVTERRMETAGPSLWTRGEAVIDGLGRTVREVVSTFDGAVPDATTVYIRDERGLVTTIEAPDPSTSDGTRTTTHYEYDGFGRVIRTWHGSGLGGTKHVVYDGLTTETHLAPGDAGPAARVRIISDVRGRLVRIEESTTQGPWGVTEYEYDANDHLVRIVDADGLTTELDHDLAGNRRWVERADRRWSYSYDLEGRVVTATVPHPTGQAAAHTSVVTYDALGRIHTRTPGAGALTAQEQTEVAFGPVVYTYDEHTDALGAAGTITSPAWVDQFRYDPSGNVTWTSQRFTAQGAPTDTRVSTATYNALGTLATATHADGTQTIYAYDRRGLPREVRTPSLSIARQVRNPAGLVVSRTLGFNAGIPASMGTWSYDALGRLREQHVRARFGSQLIPIAYQRHEYFSSSDVRHVEERIFSSYRTFDFTYDAQSQIVTADDDRGYHGEYAYTPAGRLLDVELLVPTGADAYGRDVYYDYDEQDLERVRALIDDQTGSDLIALGYDEAGSITQKSSGGVATTYRYDGDGRLRIVVRGDEREVYHYDAGGRRVLAIRSSGGAIFETRRHVGELEVIQQGGTTATELTVDLATPVARIRNGSLQYLHQNATGNLLVALNATGSVAAGFSYGAFGEVLETQGGQSDAFRRRFQDRERDELSGWYDYGHRLYDPETLIWNRIDPLYRFAPDAAGSEPRRMALYTFSLNNPLRYVDPDGRDPYQDQSQYVPPDVQAQQDRLEQTKENLPVAIASGLYGLGQIAMAFDPTGLADLGRLLYGLGTGDEEMVKDAGGDLVLGFGMGLGIGAAFKGMGKAWSWASGSADEVAGGLASLAKLRNAGDEAGTAGASLADVPDSFVRNGKRGVRSQAAGKPYCMVEACGMMLEAAGKIPDPAIVANYKKLADEGRGLTREQGAQMLRDHGFQATARKLHGGDELAALTARGTPVIAVQKLASGPHALHAVVVDGVTSKPGLGKVVAVRNPWGLKYFQKFSPFFKDWQLDVVHFGKYSP